MTLTQITRNKRQDEKNFFLDDTSEGHSPRRKLSFVGSEQDSTGGDDAEHDAVELSPKPKIGRKLGKLTKNMKRGATVKNLVSQGRRVGHNIGGMARTPGRPKKPPAKEPKLAKAPAKVGWRKMKERAVNRRM